WQPNHGRGSTYRRGKFVQTTRTTSDGQKVQLGIVERQWNLDIKFLFEIKYDGIGVDRFDSEILQLVVQFEFCSINLAVSFDYCKDIVRYVAHQLTLRPLGLSPTS